VAVLDATDVPKDADVVVNTSMHRIFFKVDEVLRDEDDSNPEDDDLLDEDAEPAKDHEMEDAEGSEPHGRNEQVQLIKRHRFVKATVGCRLGNKLR
jgi:hypothetical protein